MINLDTLEEMKKNYGEHKKEIVNSGYRFAVIARNEIYYSNNINSVYEKYPSLNPSKTFWNTSPLLIDIGKETNSLEYRKERVGERKEDNRERLKKIVQEAQDIEKEEQTIKKLEGEK